jgi:hypothetical protein
LSTALENFIQGQHLTKEIVMGKTKLTKKQREILDLSSVLENAPYLLTDEEDLTYVGKGKSGTCQCSSSKSSGGTCRAISLKKSASK